MISEHRGDEANVARYVRGWGYQDLRGTDLVVLDHEYPLVLVRAVAVVRDGRAVFVSGVSENRE